MRSTSETLRQLVVPVYVPFALSAVAAGMLLPALPLYLEDAGLSVPRIAFVLGGVGIGSALGSVPAGELVGRAGERFAMLISLALLVVMTAPLGFTETVWMLMMLRVASGIASSTLRLSRQTFVTRRVDTVQRGRAMSFVGGSFRLGLLIGPFLGGVLADLVGFTWTFAIAAGFTAAAIAFVLPYNDDLGLLPGVEAEQRVGMYRGLRMHWRRLLYAGPVPLLVMTAREGRFIVMPLIASAIGMTPTTVGVLVTVSTGADLVLFPVAGWLMDRFGRLAAMVPAFTLVVCGLVLLGLADSATGVAIAGVVMGVGNGLGSGTMLTLGSDLAPLKAPSPFLAGMSLMQGAGRVAGALLFGVLGQLFSLSTAAFGFAAVLGLAIVWLVGVVGETSDPERIRVAALR